MASIGTLSAGLGHDMGNLLLPVRVRLESLASHPLPEDARQDLAAIKSSTDYLQRLSNGLRLLASDPARAGAREGSELHAWLAEAAPVLKNVLPRGVTLETSLPDGECWVSIGRPALMQAVFNLVQNAGDAMKDQGSGTVRVEATPAEGRVRLTVSDTGPGMTDEVRRRCMEPFFTTKSRAISTGLGLSLVYGLVREAGGEVLLDSAPGRGARFTLVLRPFVRAAAPGAPRKTAVVSVADARLRALATAELKTSGYEVHLSHDHAPGAEVVIADRLDGLAAYASKMVLLDDHPARGARAIGRRPRVQELRAAVRSVSAAEKGGAAP
jgi:hypothetical protein